MRDSNSRPVYSTATGRLCPECGKPIDSCVCKKMVLAEGDGIVRIRREVNGRGGKTVTVVNGLLLDEEKLKQMTTDLKKLCGTGGTLKEGVIEIQGDHREKIQVFLTKKKFTVKLAGG